MFAIVDCNNFYVSCERVFNPALAGRPVVVLSNNDGCIISRSEEAKRIGIKMAQPYFQIKPLLKKYDVALLSSNYALYGDMSQRVMNTISSVAPAVEVYSIDEAFVDFNGFSASEVLDFCVALRKTIMRNTGIPVSVGIAATKTLAKVAGRFAKKTVEGVYCLNEENLIAEKLNLLPVAEIWGIGQAYADFLKENNINNAFEFSNARAAWVRKHLTVTGLRIRDELRGISCLKLDMIAPQKKTICTSRSFGNVTSDISVLEEAVSSFASTGAGKLRRSGLVTGVITVFIQTDRFNSDKHQYYGTKTISLPAPTNSTIEIVKYARFLLKSIFRNSYSYKKAGVIFTALCTQSELQQDMFHCDTTKKHSRLMQTVDNINNSHGLGTVKLAAVGTGEKWKLRQEKLSPSYTTKWKDIIKVNADK